MALKDMHLTRCYLDVEERPLRMKEEREQEIRRRRRRRRRRKEEEEEEEEGGGGGGGGRRGEREGAEIKEWEKEGEGTRV